jgi:ABC-2 type transport system ATP-binding protein
MTARDLFRFLGAQTPGWSDERARELLERLGGPLERTFAAMSRGESAKAMLAAALAPKPRLLVLDECFERLAPPAREEVLSVVLAEAPAEGGALLLATHDLDVAARAADRVLVLDSGRLVRDVDVPTLLEAPAGRGALPRLLRELYPVSVDGEVAA